MMTVELANLRHLETTKIFFQVSKVSFISMYGRKQPTHIRIHEPEHRHLYDLSCWRVEEIRCEEN